MRRITTLGARAGALAGALAGTLALGGCNNFLGADKAVADPNNPTVAARTQLLVGAAANLMGLQESGMAMIVCQWMQQCAGIGGRFVETQGNYVGINGGSFDGTFSAVYTGGGLIQIRQLETLADAAGDKVSKGVAEVMEVMTVGFAADIWGDIPYREAIGNPAPKFDPQMQVYDDLESLLDRAITDLAGAGAGPAKFDIFYGGDAAKWTQLAYTLKARYYLHTVEKLGNGQYTKALAAAQKGISAPANDFDDPHSTATSERNMWAQFQTTSFGSDLVAGAPLANLMNAQGDPRRALYFGKNSKGGFGGFDVSDPAASQSDPNISSILGSGRTTDVTSPQPIVTYDENQLILAEANLVLNGPGAAAPYLNAVRARYGKAAIATPTLADVMNEKYIALFQNVEYWNDYKRTCLPALKPAVGKPVIPGRFYYGQTELQTNANAPQDATLNLFQMRNANDPNACP